MFLVFFFYSRTRFFPMLKAPALVALVPMHTACVRTNRIAQANREQHQTLPSVSPWLRPLFSLEPLLKQCTSKELYRHYALEHQSPQWHSNLWRMIALAYSGMAWDLMLKLLFSCHESMHGWSVPLTSSGTSSSHVPCPHLLISEAHLLP